MSKFQKKPHRGTPFECPDRHLVEILDIRGKRVFALTSSMVWNDKNWATYWTREYPTGVPYAVDWLVSEYQPKIISSYDDYIRKNHDFVQEATSIHGSAALSLPLTLSAYCMLRGKGKTQEEAWSLAFKNHVVNDLS